MGGGDDWAPHKKATDLIYLCGSFLWRGGVDLGEKIKGRGCFVNIPIFKTKRFSGVPPLKPEGKVLYLKSLDAAINFLGFLSYAGRTPQGKVNALLSGTGLGKKQPSHQCNHQKILHQL